MQVDALKPQELSRKPERKDPRGFVMSLAVTLLGATVAAVLMMQLAR